MEAMRRPGWAVVMVAIVMLPLAQPMQMGSAADTTSLVLLDDSDGDREHLSVADGTAVSNATASDAACADGACCIGGFGCTEGKCTDGMVYVAKKCETACVAGKHANKKHVCVLNPLCSGSAGCSGGRCNDNKLIYSDDQKCVSQCGPGKTPDDSRVCTTCAQGQFADHVEHKCVQQCPAGQFTYQPDCVPFPNCTSGVGCANVSATFTNVCGDSSKIYADDKKCVATCGPGRTPKSATRVCEMCADGQYADHVAHKCVSQCPAGKAAGEGQGDAKKDCTYCPNGKFADHAAHACVATCPPGKAAGQGSDTSSRKDCSACPAGRYADHEKHQCVLAKDCTPGTVAKEDTKECKSVSSKESKPQSTSNSTKNSTVHSSASDSCCAAGTCKCLADGTCVAQCPTTVTETSAKASLNDASLSQDTDTPVQLSEDITNQFDQKF